jgi:hypothetical protein
MFGLPYRFDSLLTLVIGVAIITASYTVLTFMLPQKLVEFIENRGRPLGYLIVAVLFYFVWFDPFNF